MDKRQHILHQVLSPELLELTKRYEEHLGICSIAGYELDKAQTALKIFIESEADETNIRKYLKNEIGYIKKLISNAQILRRMPSSIFFYKAKHDTTDELQALITKLNK